MDKSFISDIAAKPIPRYIAVGEPIGVGKTTLTKRLAATFNYEVIHETIPCLEGFYQNHKQSALPTQLFFLFERACKIQSMHQGDMLEPVTVADFLLRKDTLYAELNLDADEMALYNNINTCLAIDASALDLLIYLQASTSALHSRIQQRGTKSDLKIDKTYSSQLVNAYTAFFYCDNNVPLLIVNASGLDLTNDHQIYQQLVNLTLTVKSGRYCYNPAFSIVERNIYKTMPIRRPLQYSVYHIRSMKLCP